MMAASFALASQPTNFDRMFVVLFNIEIGGGSDNSGSTSWHAQWSPQISLSCSARNLTPSLCFLAGFGRIQSPSCIFTSRRERWNPSTSGKRGGGGQLSMHKIRWKPSTAFTDFPPGFFLFNGHWADR
jgi:hypothetical protein